MKTTKKFLAILLSVFMVCSLGLTVFADGGTTPTNPGSITISDSVDTKPYDLYKIFDLTGANPDATTGEYANVAYTIADAWADFFAEGEDGADYIVSTNSGSLNPIVITTTSGTETKYINITSSNIADFAKEALVFAIENAIAPDKTAIGDGNDLVVDDLELGYYMVYPRGAADIITGNASICSLTSTVPMAEIKIKAEYPTIIKTITEDGEDPVSVNEAGIGDSIPYTMTTKIPDMTGYEKYFFVAHDTLSDGLTLNNTVTDGKNTGFTVKVGTATLVEGTGYDVDIDTANNSFRIIFKDMVNKGYTVGADVVITYSATLNKDALVNDANTNTAKIEYSNDPNVKPEFDPDEPPENPDDPDDENYTFKKGSEEVDPTEDSEDSVTETYTTSLTILKVDTNGDILSGAEFTLTGDTNKVRVTTDVSFVEATDGTYYKLANGKYTEDAPVTEHAEEADDGEYVVMESGYTLVEGQDSFTVGGITYRALKDSEIPAAGTTRYKHILSNEDKYAGDGKMYKKSVTTEVHSNNSSTTSPDTVKGYVDETTGLLTFEGLGVGEYTLTESVTPSGYNTIDPITFEISFDPDDKTFEGDNDITLEMTEIVNKAGMVLPSTGGIGTTLFYILGGVLLVGAAVLLMTKKRMNVNG